MEKVYRGKRPSEEQKQFLVTYLEDNLDLAHDRFQTVDGAKHREAEWKKLADQLNDIGGAFKDSTKWRKFWTDWRLHTKNFARKLKEDKSGINGQRRRAFKDLEERILKMIDFRAIEGDRTTEDLGFEAIDENIINCTGEKEPEPATLLITASTSADLLCQRGGEEGPRRTVLPGVPTSTPRPGPLCGRSRARQPARRGRSDNVEVDPRISLNVEEKKIKLQEEENQLKREELELRRLELEEQRETNRIFREILDCVKNRIN